MAVKDTVPAVRAAMTPAILPVVPRVLVLLGTMLETVVDSTVLVQPGAIHPEDPQVTEVSAPATLDSVVAAAAEAGEPLATVDTRPAVRTELPTVVTEVTRPVEITGAVSEARAAAIPRARLPAEVARASGLETAPPETVRNKTNPTNPTGQSNIQYKNSSVDNRSGPNDPNPFSYLKVRRALRPAGLVLADR